MIYIKGKFIVIEGPDCCGKGTLVDKLKLILNKYNFKFTREPGGLNSPVTESIRSILLDPANAMSPITEAYLYAASRAEHVQQMKDLLNDGYNIICERYVHSSVVYQGIVRGLGKQKVIGINSEALDGLKPDLVIYLDIDIETYKSRINSRGNKDRIEQEGLEFFNEVIKGYKTMQQIESSDFIIIDTTTNDADKVLVQSLETIKNLLGRLSD